MRLHSSVALIGAVGAGLLFSVLELPGCSTNKSVTGSTGTGTSSGGAASTASAQGGGFATGTGTGMSTGTMSTGSSMNVVHTSYPCTGCMSFPPIGAPACNPSTLGTPTIAYPTDGLLLPPNMNVLEVQFTAPAGASLFEVDFENAITDVKVETQCSPITPVRGGASTGCAVTLPQAAWNDIANTNRDGDPVHVTIRATANGSCVSTSVAKIDLDFAKDDIKGGIYYWQSATYGGVGGKTGGIYSHDFGSFDPTPTPFYTSGASGTCVGCHALSKDGLRMSLATDDPDADDEFGDEHSHVMDVASRSVLGGAMMSPGFQTFTHDHSKLIASAYKTMMNKGFNIYNGDGVTLLASPTLPTGMQGTQPDLSRDDGTLVFVVPQANSISQAGDDHFMGGSLYTATFDAMGNKIGTPTALLTSTGTINNYYPAIAADGSFVVFNQAPDSDAFYNRGARVKLLHLPGQANAQAIDLPALNLTGNLTNSWPRWSPFVQTYKGHHLLWVTFSSNRDYGLRLKNSGFDNCYPPESPMYDQPQPLSKTGVTYDMCAQPQIWMAGVIVDPDPSLDASDRSFPAFWLPFQDVTSHNHSAQWVDQVQSPPNPTGSTSSSSVTGSTTSTGSGNPMCGESGAACGAAGDAACCSDVVCCGGTCKDANLCIM